MFIRLSRREEWVSLLLHKYVAEKLRDNPDVVLDIAAKNLRKDIPSPERVIEHRWHTEWSHLVLSKDTDKITCLCLGLTTHDADMRQVSPFAGALTQAERISAIGEARTGWETYKSHSGQTPDWLATDTLGT